MFQTTLDGLCFKLPVVIIENPELLREILTLDTWKKLRDEQRDQLNLLLPPDLSDKERTETVTKLLSGVTFASRGGDLTVNNPIEIFITKLRAKQSKQECLLKQAYNEALEAKSKLCKLQQFHQSLKDVLISKENHLDNPPPFEMSVQSESTSYSEKTVSKTGLNTYRSILDQVRREVISETNYSMDDIASSDSECETPTVSSQRSKELVMTGKQLKAVYVQHQRRREKAIKTPYMMVSGIKVSDVITRSAAKNPRSSFLKKHKQDHIKYQNQQKKLKRMNEKLKLRRFNTNPSKKNHSKNTMRNSSKISPQCFFELIKDTMLISTEKTTNAIRLLVTDWLASAQSTLHSWTLKRSDWSNLVHKGLTYMKQTMIEIGEHAYEGLVDVNDSGMWTWKKSVDKSTLKIVCNHWVKNLKEEDFSESLSFQEQEERRFMYSHQSFVYTVKGKRFPVPPVKGSSSFVKDKKAREHFLLKKERPPQVTLLALTRDAVARLPGGVGTRYDVCNLVRQSQYLALVVTDSQITTAVSGALDRLHYEYDPCVKFDGDRRLWVYLHAGRSIGDLERIHVQQIGTKKKHRGKGRNVKKEVVVKMDNVEHFSTNITDVSSFKRPYSITEVAVKSDVISSSPAAQELVAKVPKKDESGKFDIHLSQQQLVEMTKQLTGQQSTSATFDEGRQGLAVQGRLMPQQQHRTGQPGLKLILKPGQPKQSTTGELVRCMTMAGTTDCADSQLQHSGAANSSKPSQKQVLTVDELRKLSEKLSAVSNRPIKIIHQRGNSNSNSSTSTCVDDTTS